jgi:hypothetical protein
MLTSCWKNFIDYVSIEIILSNIISFKLQGCKAIKSLLKHFELISEKFSWWCKHTWWAKCSERRWSRWMQIAPDDLCLILKANQSWLGRARSNWPDLLSSAAVLFSASSAWLQIAARKDNNPRLSFLAIISGSPSMLLKAHRCDFKSCFTFDSLSHFFPSAHGVTSSAKIVKNITWVKTWCTKMKFLILVLFNIMSKSNLLLCYYVSKSKISNAWSLLSLSHISEVRWLPPVLNLYCCNNDTTMQIKSRWLLEYTGWAGKLSETIWGIRHSE